MFNGILYVYQRVFPMIFHHILWYHPSLTLINPIFYPKSYGIMYQYAKSPRYSPYIPDISDYKWDKCSRPHLVILRQVTNVSNSGAVVKMKQQGGMFQQGVSTGCFNRFTRSTLLRPYCWRFNKR